MTFKRLGVFQTLNSKDRISSIDIFRSLAIISVVLFHFNHKMPFGFLGVDLFFLISGLLVGGLLTKDFKKQTNINFFKFFLQRGFKIWPSYYTFILVGGLIAFCFYNNTDNSAQIIPFWDLKRYLFFYQNYTGVSFHWSFDHIWSLCVEEHFYIMLPIMFLLVQKIKPEKQKTTLFIFVILTIIAGIVFKHLSYFFTNSHDTYSATHNRIDALAWGVLLNLIIEFYGQKIQTLKYKIIAFTFGVLIFVVALYFATNNDNVVFNRIYFHSIIPISFFLILSSLYYVNFSKLKPLRFIAYYSYNWYLWHPIFVIFITKQIGNNFIGLTTYLIITFLFAVGATILIEETFLKRRKVVVDKIFREKLKGI